MLMVHNNITLGQNSLAKLKLTRKKIVLIAIFSLMILGVIGVSIWFMVSSRRGEDSIALMSVDDVHSTALDYMSNGDIVKSLSLYDQQIAVRENKKEKYDLLLDESSLAASNKQYKKAIDAAKQANTLEGGSDPIALRALAEAYAASGDKKQAIVYYKKVLVILPKNNTQNPSVQRSGPSIEEIIKGLEQ